MRVPSVYTSDNRGMTDVYHCLRCQNRCCRSCHTGVQAGTTGGLPARAVGGECPVITAEGLPEDQEEEAAAKEGDDAGPSAEEPYEEGCFVKFTVQGEMPEAMPFGRPLRDVLGHTGGLAFVAFDKVRPQRKSKVGFVAIGSA